MATTKEYIDYVCENLIDYTNVTSKKMFGEYMVYINEKPIFLVCDNTVYIKIKDEINEFLLNSEKGYPYNGAKEHYIIDIEEQDLLKKIIPILERITPVPKRKTKI